MTILSLLSAWVTLGLLTACGYEMDSPRLPNHHRTLALGPIRNRTFEAELDVRLQSALRRILYRTAGVSLSAPEDSGLVLALEIERLALDRARSLDSSDVKRLNYFVAGVMTLTERATGRVLLDRQPVSVQARYDLPQADVETPAVRDDAINDVMELFAQAIVSRLLVNFDPQDRPARSPPSG